MDPASVYSAISTVLSITKTLIVYGADFKNALKEREKLRNGLTNLGPLLEQLLGRCENAQPDEPWLRGLWEPYGRGFDKQDLSPWKYRGVIGQLSETMNEMKSELLPSNSIMKMHLVQRALWNFNKASTKRNSIFGMPPSQGIVRSSAPS